jgi:predicted RNase H-like HicB family nuclease
VKLTIETDRKEDGRWIAEVPELPGVLCYGDTQREAMAKAEELAMRVIEERNHSGDGATCAG